MTTFFFPRKSASFSARPSLEVTAKSGAASPIASVISCSRMPKSEGRCVDTKFIQCFKHAPSRLRRDVGPGPPAPSIGDMTMHTQSKIDELERELLRTNLPDFRVGDTVRVHYKIVE